MTRENDSPEERKRVAERTNGLIEEFFRKTWASGTPTFRADDLRRYVSSALDGKIAPGSPDRIMRLLRQKGRINYVVIDRSQSLYSVATVTKPLGG